MIYDKIYWQLFLIILGRDLSVEYFSIAFLDFVLQFNSTFIVTEFFLYLSYKKVLRDYPE